MRSDLLVDLADCTELRLALQAQPPRIVHGTLLILAALLATALGWSAATQADLVVRAPGRVRPVTSPMKVVNAGNGETLSASAGGRVIEVHVHEGQEVHRGDVLIRLDTERLDNEITKRQRAIQAGEDELAELGRMEQLLAHQFESTRAKAEAELAQTREEVRQTTDRQAADARLAELELQNAQHEEAQVRQLVARGLVARDEQRKATARVREAQEKVDKARLPVDTGRVEIVRRALDLAAKDYTVRRQELHTKQGVKRGEVEALRIELANLKLEHEQAVVRAPMDGVVTTGDVKVGDILERGKPVVEIAEQQGFRFEAAVPSEEVGHLRVGMPAWIKLDAYDYQRYGTVAGTVVFLSPDSGVPTGQGTATYLVRIALAGEELGRGERRGRVKLGMAGQADIVTGQESLLALLVKRLRQTISLG
jgi:multidrug resistance efflux pump